MLFHHITVLFCSYCLSKDVGLNTDAVLYQTSPNSRHSNSQSKSLAFPLHHSVRDGSHGHSLSSSHHSQRSSSSSKNSGETEASAYIQSRLVLNSDFSVVINNRNMSDLDTGIFTTTFVNLKKNTNSSRIHIHNNLLIITTQSYYFVLQEN